MSTRGAIGRLVSPGHFFARYHHWDSYPSGLGKTLFYLYNGFFNKDLNAMLKFLIDDHPAGWSTINSRDFSKTPGYRERPLFYEDQAKGDLPAPECFCHGDRHEEAHEVNEKNASGSGCEWVYVFGQYEGKNMMAVLSSYRKNGHKMIGAFGCGDPEAEWRAVEIVDLDGPEPDWGKIGHD